MPYKDPDVRKEKAKERGKARRERKKAERIAAGLSADGRGKHGHNIKGSAHPRWNNAIINEQGYRLVRVGKLHPLADPNGYVPEHVLVIMSSGSPGAYLLERHPDVYVIHHENEDKLDNRFDNLQVLTREEHNRIHNLSRVRDEQTGRFLYKVAS